MISSHHIMIKGSLYSILKRKPFFILFFVVLACTPSLAQVSDTSNIRHISEILSEKNKDGKLKFLNEEVTVAGRVTVNDSVFHNYYLMTYLQDHSAGILLFSDSLEKNIDKGDSLIATGTFKLYYDKPELILNSYSIIEAKARDPAPVSLDSVFKDPARYPGMLAKGTAIVTSKNTISGNLKLNISPSDTSNQSLSVFISRSNTRLQDFNFDMLSIGDKIAVEGIVDKFVFENSNIEYQILPRTSQDITFSGIPKTYLNIFIWAGGLLVFIIFAWTLILKKQIRAKTRELSQALKDKELLMQEIHHRVKNNLAIVSGLIELQMENTHNPEAKDILKDSKSRIHSMTLIHDKLYKTESFTSVRLDTYLRDLIEAIHETFTEQIDSVDLKFNLEPLQIHVDKTMSCGLLVNELIVNAYKHAFTHNTRDGILEINLQKDNGHIILSIADNGPGLPANFDNHTSDSLGKILIDSFASQLNAKMEISTGKEGSTFSFQFPQN